MGEQAMKQAKRARFLAEHFAALAEDLERGEELPHQIEGLEGAWAAIGGGARAARMTWLYAIETSYGFHVLNAMHKRAQGVELDEHDRFWLSDEQRPAYLAALLFIEQGRGLSREPTTADQMAWVRIAARANPDAGALSDEQLRRACELRNGRGQHSPSSDRRWEELALIFKAAGLGYVKGSTLEKEWRAHSKRPRVENGEQK